MTTENLQFNRQQLEDELSAILLKAKTEYNTIENKKLALSLIDLTTLNATDTVESVRNFTQKVNDFPTF